MAEEAEHQISKFIKFSDVTDLLEQIQKSPATKKIQILEKYINSFRKYREEFHANHGNSSACSFFPILRLLIPNADRERLAYGIKNKTLGRLYVKMLGINPEGEDAKEITCDSAVNSRNYAEICHKFLQNRCKLKGNLTVYDVNLHLDLLAEYNQNNNRNKIEEELLILMREMSALEQKWLIRIILKEVSIKLTEKKILSVYHPNANKFHSQYTHLSKVCECVESGVSADEVPISTLIPFQPVQPMLSQRIKLSALDPLFSETQFYLETKMDGERFTLHVNENEYRYFSRRCHDFTKSFGSDITHGTLTPFLHGLFKIKIKSAIFDGEMMVWNRQASKYHIKGENYDVKNLKENDPSTRPCYYVFDVLYLNDKNLMSVPYAERMRLLQTLFHDKEGVLQKCHPIKLRDRDHLVECFNRAVDMKEEGVILKVEDSQYQPNERNAGWYKLKPDYIEGFITDFDLLIIGGYYNSTRSYIKEYILGVLVKTADSADMIFYATGKVEHGLSIEKRKELNQTLRPFWKEFKKTQITKTRSVIENPPNLDFGSINPDVWIEPEDSIILEIKASELIQTNSYRTNYEFRFPRIISIRSDKSCFECCTLEEFNELCGTGSKVTKLTKRHLTTDDLEEAGLSRNTSPKKKKLIQTEELSSFNNDVNVIDNICANLDFCILSANDNYTTEELEALVRKHAGRVVKNPGPKTFVVIIGKRTNTAKKVIETQIYNVATVDWLIKALSGDEPKDQLLEFHPLDMIALNENLKRDFIQKYDEFGDSYTKQITENELGNILDKMDANSLPNLIRRELYDIELEILGPKNIFNYFRLMTGFFCILDSSDLDFAKMLFISRGGVIVEDVILATHIFVDSDGNFENEQLKKPTLLDNNPKIVCYRFIIDSINASTALDIKSYLKS